MLKVFDSVSEFDLKCYRDFFLSEDLLMEHASLAIKSEIKKRFKKHSSILILSGCGNNGADGIALGRMLKGDFDVKLFLLEKPKSDIAKTQLKRAKKVGVSIIKKLQIRDFDVVVDAIFGSGFYGSLSKEVSNIIREINSFKSYKIACDFPSGLDKRGTINGECFFANITITMGALKTALFSDEAKEHTGDIVVADLGISNSLYEGQTNFFLLEEKDLILPLRKKKVSHKGNFGHAVVFSGEKLGASILCASAAFRFGAGLVSILSKNCKKIPQEIMHAKTLPKTTTAIAAGMGIGEEFSTRDIEQNILSNNIPVVIDADFFYKDVIVDILNNKQNLILTPHPKEFASLLKLTNIKKDANVSYVQKNRFNLVMEFCSKFENIVLLLKGSNVLISQNEKVYINSFGSSILSKGGTGDVLSGLIVSLLAQKYSLISAAISASLAHTMSAVRYSKNNYSLSPKDLIDNLACL